jgi:DNA-binding response OmpR family regulator
VSYYQQIIIKPQLTGLKMKRILVIDDELEIRRVVETILTRNNYLVEAISKWEYLSYSIQYFEPDLILLDVSLGGADGREICHRLKSSKETKHIPVILFSAHHNLVTNLNGCMPDAVITKPFDTSFLLETIKDTLAAKH